MFYVAASGSSPAVPPKAFHDTDDDEDDILAVPRSRVSNGDMYRDEKPPGADGQRAEGDGKTAQDDGKKMEEAMALHEPMYETVDIGAQVKRWIIRVLSFSGNQLFQFEKNTKENRKCCCKQGRRETCLLPALCYIDTLVNSESIPWYKTLNISQEI